MLNHAKKKKYRLSGSKSEWGESQSWVPQNRSTKKSTEERTTQQKETKEVAIFLCLPWSTGAVKPLGSYSVFWDNYKQMHRRQ